MYLIVTLSNTNVSAGSLLFFYHLKPFWVQWRTVRCCCNPQYAPFHGTDQRSLASCMCVLDLLRKCMPFITRKPPLFAAWRHRLEQVHLKDLPRNAQVSNSQQFPAGDKTWSLGTLFWTELHESSGDTDLFCKYTGNAAIFHGSCTASIQWWTTCQCSWEGGSRCSLKLPSNPNHAVIVRKKLKIPIVKQSLWWSYGQTQGKNLS